MSQSNLDEHQRLARVVTKSKWAEIDGEIEVFPAAFRLREKGQSRPQDEKYLSTSWLDYFSGDIGEQAQKCVETMSDGGFILRKSTVLAVCKVGDLQCVGQKHKVSIRARHNPKKWNPAYAGIHGMSIESQTEDLLNEIVSTSVSECFKVSEIIAESD